MECKGLCVGEHRPGKPCGQQMHPAMAGIGARGMLGIAFMPPEHPEFPELREEFFRNYQACMTQRTYVFEGVAQMIESLVERNIPSAPAPLLEAARQVGVRPIECVYVGDDLRGVQAGKAAGMGTVAATYGYLGCTDVQEWGADSQIETPLALLGLLRFRAVA